MLLLINGLDLLTFFLFLAILKWKDRPWSSNIAALRSCRLPFRQLPLFTSPCAWTIILNVN